MEIRGLMNKGEIAFLRTVLEDKIETEVLENVLSARNLLTRGKRYTIFHPDILRKIIDNGIIEKRGILEETSITDKLINQVSKGMRNLGYCVLDYCMINNEVSDCCDCVAFRWVIHQTGKHRCRLHFDIDEYISKDGYYHAIPLNECIKPKNVGACYMIARELGLPEPMVGKLDYNQYAKYMEEKGNLCQ